MLSFLSHPPATEVLANVAKQRLHWKQHEADVLSNDPFSDEAFILKLVKAKEAERDEVQLAKLEKRKEAVDFNATELVSLLDEQVTLQGDKVCISRRDTGETLYEVERRGSMFLLKTPARKAAIEQMANVGMVKQSKGLPVVMVKKEELFSTLRKALLEFKEKMR